MLAYLLDEHLSPAIAEQVRAKQPALQIVSIRYWRGGRLMRQSDEMVLTAAKEDGLTLVSYDQKTIVPLLVRWGCRRYPMRAWCS